ncbi:hypothetical protein FRC06_000486 [Ceratobasidium sp. 370]|nr:hypothetical protein FRC06_000486 [Ceratobasidium sp. 370]
MFSKLEKPFDSLNRPSKALSTSTAPVVPPLATLSLGLLHCLGLRPVHHEKIQAVVERSTHGGTTSIHTIARQNYGKEYNSLTAEEKVSVRVGVTATAEWTVHLDPAPHIRHKNCLQTCKPSASTLTPSDICSSCASLLKTPSFQKALARKPVENPANLKYVPHASRQKNQAKMYLKYMGLQKIIDDADSKSTTPLMQFVHRVVQGKIDNSRVFSGLVQTIAAKEDKLARGIGMQNLRYPPGWTDFCLIAHSISPRVYQFLGSSGFPVLGERDLRKRRSRSLQFPTGICDQTFERASKFLNTLGYTGPVSVSCDDTQLLRKWSPYYNSTAKKWFVLGGTGDPIEIDDSIEDVHGYLVKATEAKEQASKASSTAAPRIPVFILAAMAIGPCMKADDLFAIHSRLIQGLLDAEICVLSYACDGSATERKVTQLFIRSAVDQQVIEIPHPEPGFEPHRVTLYFYGPKNTPIVSIQDSKHAAKTCRNGLYSGTRSFVMTNCVLYYQQLLALSRHPHSPLYQRDVVKTDRQDDRAALRLFSSATVRHIFVVMKEQAALSNPDPVLSRDLTGLAVYIFVIGDLVDAFQNRFLTISERCRMVFRARYFMEIWSSSLTALGYSHNTHFITREAQQILQYLFDGFIALLLVYRDHLDHDNYPLLPWLHSTEPAEHTFGELRKLKPDFTYSDFLHLQPKVTMKTNASVLNGEYDSGSKANARAAGYYHTEYSDNGINISALACFPTASVIHEASRLAFYEAKSLFALCGVPVSSDLYSPAQPNPSTFLPINKWLPELDPDDDSDADSCSPSIAAELHHILQAEVTRPLGPSHLEDKMDLYSFAAVALEVEDQNEIDLLPEHDNEHGWRAIRNEITREYPHFPLPSVVIAGEVREAAFRLDPCRIDTDGLVDLRAAHETTFAKKAIRIGGAVEEYPVVHVSDDAEIPENAHSARQKVVKKMHEALKTIQETVGAGTGAVRRLHHQGEVSVVEPTGNAANAAEAAGKRSAKVMASRMIKLKEAKVKCAELVGRAGVSELAPMRTGSFAIVFTEEQLWLGEVLTMYSKGAGKGTTHAWVEEATNISSLSYVVVQLWEHWGDGEFRSMVKSTALHHADRFAHLPWQCLLFVMRPSSTKHISPGKLRATDALYDTWKALFKEKASLAAVVKETLRRSRTTASED